MRILIIGSSGFIGRNFLKSIRIYKSLELMTTYNSNCNNNESVKYKLGDKLPPKIIQFKPEIVINLAWIGIPDFSIKTSGINEKKHKLFINKITKLKSIKKIIYAGSCVEYKSKLNSKDFEKYKYFIKSKKEILLHLKMKSNVRNINHKWLRIFYVYGKGQRSKSLISQIIKSIKNNKRPSINNVYGNHDFVYIEDVCSALMRLIFDKKKKVTYDIGAGKATFILDILRIIELNLNKNNNFYKSYIHKNISLKNKTSYTKLIAKKSFHDLPKYQTNIGIKKVLF